MIGGALAGILLAGQSPTIEDFPPRATLQPREALATINDVNIYGDGYGSAIALDPRQPGYFYLMTDRGPSFERGKDTRVFPIPSFSPQIGRFKLEGSVLRRVAVITMKNTAGAPLDGLPNPVRANEQTETALTVEGDTIQPSPDGLDPEGLVALKDGTFWVSDEYGPYLLHLDPSGRTIERVSPFGDGPRTLPAVLSKRRPNRGMEGLTILPDGETLTGLMQAPLDNPTKAGRSSQSVRLVLYNTRSGASRQYIYLVEAPSLVTSDIAAIDANTFLVLERDGQLPGDPSKPSTVKRVYQFDLRHASEVGEPVSAPSGKLVNGRTLEELTPDELREAGVVPVEKTLVADLRSLGYPHDKLEGLAIADNRTIALSNDDDFGITDGPGGMAPKILPLNGSVDFGEVYFVKVSVRLK